MKVFIIRILFLILGMTSYIFSHPVYADENAGIYDDGVRTRDQIRNGDFTMNDIPQILAGAVEMLLGIAGTISIVALIYHAVNMQLSSGITGDSSGVDKAKAGMKGALLGFALSLSAWFIVTKFIEILTVNT